MVYPNDPGMTTFSLLGWQTLLLSQDSGGGMGPLPPTDLTLFGGTSASDVKRVVDSYHWVIYIFSQV